MKKVALRLLCLTMLLVPFQMEAGILVSQVTGAPSGSSGSALGQVNVNGTDISVFLLYNGLEGNIQEAGLYGPPDDLNTLLFALSGPFPPPSSGLLMATFSGVNITLAQDIENNPGAYFFNIYTDAIFEKPCEEPCETTTFHASASGNLELRGPLEAYNGGPLVTPEPGTWAMLGLGLGAVAWKLRRRSR